MNLSETEKKAPEKTREETQNSAGTPKISVIVPVYKVEKYLAECIESVLAQTFTDFELILVDDGSPDNCGKICDDYAARDPRIRVFHKPNGGVSSARNLGIDHARGEWIAFVDSDDTVGEKYLEHLYGDGPLTGTLVVSGLTYLNEKGEETHLLQFPEGTQSPTAAFRERRLYNYGYPVSKLYDATVISRKHLRFDLEISMAEDMIFMADYLAEASAVEFRADCRDYKYWRRQGSLSTRYSTYESEFKLFLRTRAAFENLGISNFKPAERKTLKWVFFRAVSCLYRPLFPPRALRFEKLHESYGALHGNEFSGQDSSQRERLFLRRHFRLFDFVESVLFRLRYGALSGAWRRYRTLASKSLTRRRIEAMRAEAKRGGV